MKMVKHDFPPRFNIGTTTVPHLNDLDHELKCKVSRFAGDTKLATSVRSNDGYIRFQSYLDKLSI